MRPNTPPPPYYQGRAMPPSPRYSGARLAMRPRMPNISSVEKTETAGSSQKTEAQYKTVDNKTKPGEERASLMKDLDTRIDVQDFDNRVQVKAPEVASLTCSDLLTAYRLTQNLTRNRPYRYDPA